MIESPQNDTFKKLLSLTSSKGLKDEGLFLLSGEKLIRDTLTNAKKFETDTNNDTFRRKCEDRLFQGQKTAKWNEIRGRAAMSDAWPLHRPDALDVLKTKAINEGQWRDLGDSVEKGPFMLKYA